MTISLDDTDYLYLQCNPLLVQEYTDPNISSTTCFKPVIPWIQNLDETCAKRNVNVLGYVSDIKIWVKTIVIEKCFLWLKIYKNEMSSMIKVFLSANSFIFGNTLKQYCSHRILTSFNIMFNHVYKTHAKHILTLSVTCSIFF